MGGRSRLVSASRRPAKLGIVQFSTWQLVTQFAGALAGVLVLRALSVTDYALFTLAISLSSALFVVLTSGFTAALQSIAPSLPVGVERSAFIHGLVHHRARRAILLFAISAPVIYALFRRVEASQPVAASLVVFTLLLVGLNLVLHASTQVNAIEYRTTAIRVGSLITSVARLAVTLLLTMAGLLSVFVAMALQAMHFALNAALQGRLRESLGLGRGLPKWQPAAQRRASRLHRKLLPSGVYAALKGQLPILVLAVTGSGADVAGMGALARFAILFAVVTTTINVVLVPRVARSSPSQVRAKIVRVLIGATIPCLLLGSCMAAFPEAFLWILGPGYSGLSHELLLYAAATASAFMSGILASLNQSRGFVRLVWLQIAASMAVIVSFAFATGLESLRDVLIMLIAEGLVRFCLGIVVLVLGLRGMRA